MDELEAGAAEFPNEVDICKFDQDVNNKYSGDLNTSAARFGVLSPYGRLFETFGYQNFVLATLKFGNFLGDFLKIVKKTCLNQFLA